MKRWWIFTVLLAAVPGMASAASPGTSPPASRQAMTYAVYFGGVNALATDLTMSTAADGTYAAALTTQTRGLLGHLAPWHGSFTANGLRRAPGAARSLAYHGETVWRGDVQTEDFAYDPGGRITAHKIVNKGRDKSPPLDHALADGTTDALTATLLMLDGVAAGQPCAGDRAVFDGLRRYRLVFRDEGAETLAASTYSSFSGAAERCTAQVIPDGGKWHDKPRGWLNIQDQGQQRGALPTVWVARLAKDGPAVPVRAKVVTSYGTLMMQLVRYRTD